MEALVGVIFGLIEMIGAVIELLSYAVAFVLEIIYVFFFRGPTAASDHAKLRKEERQQKTDAADARHTVFRAFGVLLVFVALAIWVIIEIVSERRIRATKPQLERIADSVAADLQDDSVEDPEPGMMDETDPWGTPIELSIDRALLGSLVIARSAGPDTEMGTEDDIQEMRIFRAKAKDVGGELADRAWEKLKKRAAELVPKK